MRFGFAVRSTEATPTEHANGFRLILAMPAFHGAILLMPNLKQCIRHALEDKVPNRAGHEGAWRDTLRLN